MTFWVLLSADMVTVCGENDSGARRYESRGSCDQRLYGQVLLDVSLSGRVFESPVSVMEVGLLGLWAGRKEVGNGELLTIVPSSGRARQYYREKRDW